MNPYSGAASRSSSGASSPADDVQPNTPRFPVELVGSSGGGNGGGGDERKYGRGGLGVVEHPAILRPGFGAGMSSRLSGPFLAELE